MLKQLSLFPELVPVQLTQDEKYQQIRQEQQELFESLGGLCRVTLCKQISPERIYPGKLLWTSSRKPVVIHRIFDVMPRWRSASVECCPANQEEIQYGFSGSGILRDYDEWLKGRKFQVYSTGELWSFDPVHLDAKHKPQIEFASKRQVLNFIWQWFIHACQIKSAFSRQSLNQAMEHKDSFILNGMEEETRAKVTNVLRQFDLALDAQIFEEQFWLALCLVCSYGINDVVPDEPDTSRPRPSFNWKAC